MYAPGAAAAAAGTTDDEGCEERGGLLNVCISGAGAVGLEQSDQMGTVLFANAFQFQNFPEIGIGFVGNVN